jgi:hypothetical protein
MEFSYNSPKTSTCAECGSKGERRDEKGEGSSDGESGKLDKVADNRKETFLVRHLEVPVLPTTVPYQGSV